jgi:hypothetical protein
LHQFSFSFSCAIPTNDIVPLSNSKHTDGQQQLCQNGAALSFQFRAVARVSYNKFLMMKSGIATEH